MKHYTRPTLLTVLALLVLAASPDFSGKVVVIADGDTITVLHDKIPLI